MPYRIRVDRQKCQGIGACVGAAPDVFDLDSSGKAIVINSDVTDEDAILEAAEACPLEAITVYGEDGVQIYP